jgi:hypothetical protein
MLSLCRPQLSVRRIFYAPRMRTSSSSLPLNTWRRSGSPCWTVSSLCSDCARKRLLRRADLFLLAERVSDDASAAAGTAGTAQQRPNDMNLGVSLYSPEVANGTGVQYLLATTTANFPLGPTGPLVAGSGASRT